MGQISLTIPVIGQPFASEAAKADNNFTTLQTVINGNIDSTNVTAAFLASTLNLSERTITGSTSATSGQMIFAEGSGSYTLTLPAPAANATVSVVNLIGAGGVVSVSGTNLNGVGLSGASTFPLGTYGATATLISDGSGWAIIAGQQDTGWVSISSLGSGVTDANATGVFAGTVSPPQARLVGDDIRLRGAVNGHLTGTVVTLPSSTRPGKVRGAVGALMDNATTPDLAPVNLLIATTGVITVNALDGYLFFDAIRFPV